VWIARSLGKHSRTTLCSRSVTNCQFRPASISTLGKTKGDGKEGSAPLVELDRVTMQKAEAHFYSFYEMNADVDPEAQGPAVFH